ncbi:hypothetical protein FRC07_003874 [Ceratobasidium sp. 392]|nr:hypothetical protein FRC07_003874 [Ceratobasidium sp. 392]
MTTISSARHTLEIPELVLLICSFALKTDYVKLIYLSRRIFVCVIPAVWEDVDILPWLFLIPGVIATKRKRRNFTSDDPQHHYTFEFPKALHTARFQWYSSFVKVLRTSAPYLIKFPVKFPYLGTHVPLADLLPNLQGLAVQTFGEARREDVNWVHDILSPKILRLEILSAYQQQSSGADYSSQHSWLDPWTYSELVESIARTCPRLTTLRIFSNGTKPLRCYASDSHAEIGRWMWLQSRHDSQVNDASEELSPSLRIYSLIQRLQNIRSLSIGYSNVDEKSFQALGQLPHLENLSLHADRYQPAGAARRDSMTLVESSFPRLRHLALYGANESVLSPLPSLLPLFRNLETAIITCKGDYHRVPGNLRQPLLQVVQALSQHSLYLTDLTVSIVRESEWYFELFWPIVTAFKQMSRLKCLKLGRLILNPEVHPSEHDPTTGIQNNSPKITWSHFFDAVPNLEELDLQLQSLKLHELRTVAAMLPRLRLLILWNVVQNSVMQASSPTASSTNQPVAIQPIIIRCRLNFSAPNKLLVPGKVYISIVARHVHSFWPNAIFESNKSWMYSHIPSNMMMAAGLNDAMASLRAAEVT